MIRVEHGDCRTVMLDLALDGVQVDSIVTDPPYHLGKSGFMNKAWDAANYGIAFQTEIWRLAFQLLKPGGHLLVFGGSRTYHRLACAIEDGGFALRDCLMWLYGSGLPKSRALLKPAYEPILLARKPGPLQHLNIDACKIPSEGGTNFAMKPGPCGGHPEGRWPANILHDESREVLDAFAAYGERKSTGGKGAASGLIDNPSIYGKFSGANKGASVGGYGDTGSVARFFYSAKANAADRAGSKHPTIKPVNLVEYLAKLITPPGGLILDPFAGSGTLATAAHRLGMDAILIEREGQYIRDIEARIAGLLRP